MNKKEEIELLTTKLRHMGITLGAQLSQAFL